MRIPIAADFAAENLRCNQYVQRYYFNGTLPVVEVNLAGTTPTAFSRDSLLLRIANLEAAGLDSDARLDRFALAVLDGFIRARLNSSSQDMLQTPPSSAD